MDGQLDMWLSEIESQTKQIGRGLYLLHSLVVGHNSLSKELLAGSQKGEYCSAYSKSPGPGVFCICPTVQVFSNLWVGDFCVCVVLLGFFCVVEVVLSLFLFLS